MIPGSINPAILVDWTKDPRVLEGWQLERFAKDNEQDNEIFKEWNPIPKDELKNIDDLRKNFHPVKIKDEKIFRIDDAAIDAIKDSYLINAKMAEELTNLTLIGRYVTFHTNGYPLFFNPSIAEVLKQLPEQILNQQEHFYFTSEFVTYNPDMCTIGYHQRFHIAVTNLYQQ